MEYLYGAFGLLALLVLQFVALALGMYLGIQLAVDRSLKDGKFRAYNRWWKAEELK